MTKAEAKKLEDAARKWATAAVRYCGIAQQEHAFLALINSMIEGPKTNLIETHAAANDATKTTYITRCPACHAKIEWGVSGTKDSAQTLADIAHENTQCQAAYLAKKPE